MFKVLGFYSLPEGTDPDKFWKWHTEVHAADVKRIAGPRLKKYVLNRVTKWVRGEPRFFVLIENWWENEEARVSFTKDLRAAKNAEGQSIGDDFASRVVNHQTALVEEWEIKL